jgi:nucleoside-diphosphate-sugar epimerase
VQALQGHHGLYGLDIVSPQAPGIVKTYPWDALQDLPPVNTIIHLAGKAHDTKNTSSAQSYFDINLGLTQKIFDYFLQSQAEKFILFSSVKAVADTVQGEYLTEEDTPNPQTPYGQSKLAAEQYITEKYQSWLNTKDQRLKTNSRHPKTKDQRPTAKDQPPKTIHLLRPAMIHGPGNKGNLNLLYNIVKKGIPWPLGSYQNRRSMLSIDNLAFIIQQLIERDIPSGTYNLADDDTVSTNDIIRLMAQSMQKKAAIINTPKAIINLMAQTGDLLHLPLNTERLKKLTESYVVSNAKIKNTLGITQLPTNAHEGLLKTFKSFSRKI